MIRGRPWPLHRGHRTSRSATGTEASGSRGLTRKSRSTTVPQLSQAMTSHGCFAVIAAVTFGHFSGIATRYPGLELASGLAFPDPVTTGRIHHCLPFSLWSTRKRAKNYTGSGGVSDSGERCNAFNTESRGSCRCVGHSRLGSRRHRRSKKLLPAHSRKSPGRPDHRAGSKARSMGRS